MKRGDYRWGWTLCGVGGDPSLCVQVHRLGDLLQCWDVVLELPFGEAGLLRVVPAGVLVHVVLARASGTSRRPSQQLYKFIVWRPFFLRPQMVWSISSMTIRWSLGSLP